MSAIARTVLKEERRLWCVYAVVVCCLVFVVSVLCLEASGWRELAGREDAALGALATNHVLADGLRDAQRYALLAARSDDPDQTASYRRTLARTRQLAEADTAVSVPAASDDGRADGLRDARSRFSAVLVRLQWPGCAARTGSIGNCVPLVDSLAKDAYHALRGSEQWWSDELAAIRAEMHALLRIAVATLLAFVGLVTAVLVTMACLQRRVFQQIVDTSERLDAQLVQDPLTGLMNRRMILSMVDAHEQARHVERLACLYLDVDGFKQVNDTWGHPEGDRLLREIADVLRDNARGDDVVARMGGDEFVMWVTGFVTYADLMAMAQRLIDRIAATSAGRYGDAAPIGVSIGISVFPDMVARPADLVPSADAAMYQAKREGKARFVMTSALAPVARTRPDGSALERTRAALECEE
jgi:diguanylate cyclase (GGDEF)-like protein